MEGLALVLFYITLIGIIACIGLIIYSAIKKDFKYRPKKLAIVLGIFIVAFIGSTIFFGAVQSPESKAKFEASQKAKEEEKAKKELAEAEEKAEKEKLKQEEEKPKDNSEDTIKAKEIPVEAEVKEESPKVDDRFTISAESNTTPAVDELLKKGKEDSKNITDSKIKEAIKFINDNYNNYWIDNSTMEKTIYYGSLLQYSNSNNDIKSLGIDAVQVVKYVYRKIEKVEDTSTQSNLKQIKKGLDKIPEEYKK